MLPFTREQFVAVFASYNLAVWPAQAIAYALAAAMVVMLLRPAPVGSRLIGGGLALMWAWTGIAYHAWAFSAINKAAPLFALLFVLQAALLSHAALRGRLRFGPASRPRAWLGGGLLVYALLLYPLVGLGTGHRYPALPMFGISPCPVAIFSFGLLLLATPPLPRRLLVIPFLWSLIGGSAAILLDVPQDWPLLLCGIVAIPLIVVGDRPRHRAATAS